MLTQDLIGDSQALLDSRQPSSGASRRTAIKAALGVGYAAAAAPISRFRNMSYLPFLPPNLASSRVWTAAGTNKSAFPPSRAISFTSREETA